ncbi:MAG: DUF2520 domain-containing protein [Burkholderiales bacterium]|nr:DUF2520 domain-containing protein [Flavobacterium sp.]
MIKVSIIGSGNLAQHLISVFNMADSIDLVQVYARQKNNVLHLINDHQVVSAFESLTEADLYILAVSDSVIAEISALLPFKNKLVAHTSGSIAITELDDKNRKAVFYPLQTFSKNKAVDFHMIPICLESQNASDFQILEKVAKAVSEKVYAINSEQRKALHVAAVFVNNFVNHLYQTGYDICSEYQVPFEILQPLITETAKKVMTLSPAEAQTGPAKRRDQQTIDAHLAMLTDSHQQSIYKLLTQSIQSHE